MAPNDHAEPTVEILPCPWCRSEASPFYISEEEGACIVCDSDDCTVTGPSNIDPDGMVLDWNRVAGMPDTINRLTAEVMRVPSSQGW